jgi:hypothetical protein
MSLMHKLPIGNDRKAKSLGGGFGSAPGAKKEPRPDGRGSLEA